MTDYGLRVEDGGNGVASVPEDSAFRRAVKLHEHWSAPVRHAHLRICAVSRLASKHSFSLAKPRVRSTIASRAPANVVPGQGDQTELGEEHGRGRRRPRHVGCFRLPRVRSPQAVHPIGLLRLLRYPRQE